MKSNSFDGKNGALALPHQSQFAAVRFEFYLVAVFNTTLFSRLKHYLNFFFLVFLKH